MRTDGWVYAAGAVGLGLIGLAFGDFPLQWQPVPEGVPARETLAAVNAAALLIAGGAVFWRRTARPGAIALAAMYGLLWTLILKGPGVAADPGTLLPWLGFTESLAMAAGGLMLVALLTPGETPRLRLAARLLFGVCPLVFGLCHFAYASFTAAMVPAWIPGGGLFWAYATGVAHVAGGLGVLSGVFGRLAATSLAAMFAVFALALHLPRVIAAPASHIEWVMLGIATSLAGAAWLVRAGMEPGMSWPLRRPAA